MVSLCRYLSIAALCFLLFNLGCGNVASVVDKKESNLKTDYKKPVDLVKLELLSSPTGTTATDSEVGGEGIVVIGFSDKKRKAIRIDDGSEVTPAPEISKTFKFKEKETLLEELRNRIGPLNSGKQLRVNEIDSTANVVVTAETKDRVSQISLYKRDDLSLITEKNLDLGPLPEELQEQDQDRLTSVTLSPYANWLLLESGDLSDPREVILIDLASWKIERKFIFHSFESVSWAYRDSRLIITDGCFCEGQDGRSLEIHDLEGNLAVFSMKFNEYRLGPHDGLHIEEDYFWIAEEDMIHFWDLNQLNSLETVPITPALDFETKAMTSNTRHVYEDFRYMPFALTTLGKSDVLIARSDDEFFTLTRYTPQPQRKIGMKKLPMILWMDFMGNSILAMTTVDGAMYKMAITSLIEQSDVGHNKLLKGSSVPPAP